jgi:hypothetical protein
VYNNELSIVRLSMHAHRDHKQKSVEGKGILDKLYAKSHRLGVSQ